MKKVYMVFILKDGELKLTAEYDTIKQCNRFLEDNRYRVIDAWRKK